MRKTTSKPISKFEIHYKTNEDTENTRKINDENTKDNLTKEEFSDYKELNPEQRKIADWLENLKFRKQVVGGISEYDVWKKIIELNAMYEEAIKAEHVRCDTLIDHYIKAKNNKEVKEEREKIRYE